MSIDISDKDIAGTGPGNFGKENKQEVKTEVKQEVKQPVVDPKTSKLFGK
jgi:hypothetical protein